jgi:hypothetical protein
MPEALRRALIVAKLGETDARKAFSVDTPMAHQGTPSRAGAGSGVAALPRCSVNRRIFGLRP